MKNIEIKIPEHANQVLHTLQAAGYEAYVVGGCVRDSILGREPGDWDITTSARPEEVKKCFRRTVDTGIQHGTVTVLLGDDQYEVTTYRLDGEYEDGRHPKSVTFTPSLVEDLKRRDFTINAMAYNDEDGLVDEFDGLGDIDRKIIRAVGDPMQRFSEDALRMMRAVRFSAQLDYEIEDKTMTAIRHLAPTLSKISAERVRVELEKLLVSDHPEKLKNLYCLGITNIVLPELDRCMEVPQHNPHHRYSVGDHIIKSCTAVRADKVLRLTMLFHDMGKPACHTTDDEGIDHFHGHALVSADIADKVMKRLRYDNDTRKKVVRLVHYHDIRPENTERAIRRAMVTVGPELFPMLFEVKIADGMAQSAYRVEEKKAKVAAWRQTYETILEHQDPLTLKELAVTGNDLQAKGIQGRQIGQVLHRMLEEVLDHPDHNDRDYLLTHFAGDER